MYPSEVDKALSLAPDDAVVRLLELPENQWFERKSGVVKAADLVVPLIAMANSEGGIVMAGLYNGTIVPVSDHNANYLRQAAADFTRPQVRVVVDELNTAAGRVMVFRVTPGHQVHESHKGEC